MTFTRIYSVTVVIVLVLIATGSVYVLRSSESPLLRCTELSEGVRIQCFQEEILKAAAERSVIESFELLATAYALDDDFARDCHGNTHEIGEVAYERFARGEHIPYSELSSYCGYGFFHGFIEELFVNGGSSADARRFCFDLRGKTDSQTRALVGACYHGIGHGVTDGSNPTLWGDAYAMLREGLTICSRIGDSYEHKKRCASGAFNSIAIMHFNPKYKIAIDKSRPYAFCDVFESYEKTACVQELNTVVLRTSGFDFKAAVDRILLIADMKVQADAAEALAGYQAIKNPDLSNEAEEGCRKLPETSTTACLKGFAAGLVEGGTPGAEHVDSLAFCTRPSFSEEERNICTDRVLWYLGAVMSVEQFEKICKEFNGSACEI